MKLIYAKGACSLSVHILLNEMGFDFETEHVSLKDRTKLLKYNSMGYVPVLVLDGEQRMTEAIVILQYLADIEDENILFPQLGDMARVRCQEWLSFLSSEVHKSMGTLMSVSKNKLPKEVLDETWERINLRMKFLDDFLAENLFLVNEQFSIADMYAVAILRIGDHIKVHYEQFSNVAAYKRRLEEIPSVKLAIEEEDREEDRTLRRPIPVTHDFSLDGDRP